MAAFSKSLTDVQLEIMNLVWAHPECTVSFLWDELRERRPVARNTVLTMVNRLVERGVLKRKRKGRSFVYSSRLSREVAQETRVRDTVENLFQGSAESLIRSVLGHHPIDREEIARLRKVLAEAEKRAKKRR